VKTIVIILLSTVLLTACQTPPPRPEPEPEPQQPPPAVTEPVPCEPQVKEVFTGTDETLLFLANLKQRSQADLKTALYQARKDFTATGAESARMKLIVLYLQPGTSFRSEAQALQLLDPYIRGDTSPLSPYRGIAQLILANLEESRKTDSAVQVQAVKTREEQKRADELQRKLDALKDVERAMIEKDQKQRKK
jgi:hypothetical protein